MEQSLSLPAELLLLAVDPGDGGLLPHSRGRFRRALAVASRSTYALPVTGWLTKRAAMAELTSAGLLRPGTLELVDRGRATDRFRAVCACVEHPGDAGSRDWEVLVLLAWSGVLARRLNKDERRAADRRMRQLFKRAEDGLWGFPGAEHELPQWVPRLGGPAVLDEEIDLFDSPEFTDFGRDQSGFSGPFG